MTKKNLQNKLLFIFIIPFVIIAELSTNVNTDIQIMRKSNPANRGNIDSGFVRGEVIFEGGNNEKLSGLLHLRAQSDFGLDKSFCSIRQLYFSLPVSTIKLLAGRWYESYSPGVYFGRYLFMSGDDSLGSGKMDRYYSILNGFNISTPLFEKYKTDLHFSCIANTADMEDISVAVRVMSNPADFLTMNIGANIQAVSSEKEKHKLSFSAIYKIIENLRLIAEYGIINVSNIKNNSWLMAGLDIPTAGIVDQFRFEIEYKKERINEDGDGDLGWIIALVKELADISFCLNIGSDPNAFGSEDVKDIGMHLKVKTSF